MMKFKQRLLAILAVVMVGIPYLWVKYKRSRARSPVVEVVNNEDSLLRTLLLDNGFDLNNLDHRHHDTRKATAVVKRSRTVDTKALSTSKPASRGDIIAPVTQEKPLNLEKQTEGRLPVQDPWEIWKKMVSEKRITSNGTGGATEVEAILKALRTLPILKFGVGYKGSQLKASMYLERNQRTVFKPKRYDRDYVITDGPYSGFDRHNGEIAAFHLDRLLGFYRAPPVSGRVVNLKTEVLPVTTKALKDTFLNEGNNVCFYGVCYYCKRADLACADGDIMEGSVTIWLPAGWDLRKWRHPWQRTYTKRKARWETDPTYCSSVMKTPPYDSGPRLMSIIDTAVFDFLIGNADRHHYETFYKSDRNGFVLHLDNGKSFGNPDEDEMSILAPLYQCCRILRSTWSTLNELNNRKDKRLSKMLEQSMSSDPLVPVLSQKHLDALDRRLKKIVEQVRQCIDKNSEDVVFVDG